MKSEEIILPAPSVRNLRKFNPESVRKHLPLGSLRWWMVVILFGLALGILGYKTWKSSQFASRSEVRLESQELPPSCRAIFAERFKVELSQKGAPLSNKEISDLKKGLEDCDVIEQQVEGLRDSTRTN
jgi:hypothetical protein